MNYVYLYQLRSENHPDRHYTGKTSDLKTRLDCHNGGQVAHTRKFRPWQVDVAVAFRDKAKAVAFERYLKTSSGRAFAKRHF